MDTAEGPPLLTHDAPGRATLTLNRPRHLNRLHREDLQTLQSQIAQLAADRTLRVVVITGRGRASTCRNWSKPTRRAVTRSCLNTPLTRWKPCPCPPSPG
jgi:1,4-dihydroxy-2-naphthoyl-CoA synthase